MIIHKTYGEVKEILEEKGEMALVRLKTAQKLPRQDTPVRELWVGKGALTKNGRIIGKLRPKAYIEQMLPKIRALAYKLNQTLGYDFEDAEQMAVVSALEAIQKLGKDGAGTGYYEHNIMQMIKRDMLRQAIKDQNDRERIVAYLEGLQVHDDSPSNPEDRMVESSRRVQLSRAINNLTDEDAFIISRYFFMNRTMSQIAVTMDTNKMDISRRIKRICASLRQRLVGKVDVSDLFFAGIRYFE